MNFRTIIIYIISWLIQNLSNLVLKQLTVWADRNDLRRLNYNKTVFGRGSFRSEPRWESSRRSSRPQSRMRRGILPPRSPHLSPRAPHSPSELVLPLLDQSYAPDVAPSKWKELSLYIASSSAAFMRCRFLCDSASRTISFSVPSNMEIDVNLSNVYLKCEHCASRLTPW